MSRYLDELLSIRKKSRYFFKETQLENPLYLPKLDECD